MIDKVPQFVILDLLPLYVEDEISEETRSLIQEYLEKDPQLAKLVKQAKATKSMQEIPAPLKKETEMDAMKKARSLMVQQYTFMVLAVILTLMIGLSYVFLSDEPRGAEAPFAFAGLAAFFWIAFFWVNKKIK